MLEDSNCVAPLLRFLRFASISAHAQAAATSVRCAAWLAGHLKRIGMHNVNVSKTKGNPIVTAEWLVDRERPTVLIYGHYDVQPADPLSQWISPPFEPVVRGEYLYARGASDDKGQLFCHVCAVERLLQSAGHFPVNVKFVVEGEEEIGSPNLAAFLEQNKRELSADVAVVSDNCILGPDRPAITYALRGSLDVELHISGQGNDLHSGNFGGVVYNPLRGLCEILAKLQDESGRILIPGFYDQVANISGEERDYLRRHGPSDKEVLKQAGASIANGEPGFTLYENATVRPSVTITGITGGYQGPGPKGVIAAHASAKLDFRLVPHQDPSQIDKLFRDYIAGIVPSALKVRIFTQKRTQTAITSLKHPAIHAAFSAYKRAFGRSPVFIRSGGTIPIVGLLQRIMGIPTVLMGFALPDDALHAPNERLHLPTFFRGISTSAHFLTELVRNSSVNLQSGAVGSLLTSKFNSTAGGALA